MSAITTSRIAGITTSVAVKVPCKAISTTNVSLSGEQTIDGVACVTGDRVLVNGQSTASQNGIYVVNTSEWSRADDFNGARDAAEGTIVYVHDGSNVGLYKLDTVDPITIGTSNISFSDIIQTIATGLGDLTGNSDDITQGSTNLFMTTAERTKLGNLTDDDIVAGANITVTGGNGSDWTIAGGGAASVAIDDITDVTITTPADNEVLAYDNGTGEWINQTAAEAGLAAASHTHATSDITSGTFADARIAESNVTQHEGAITVTLSQVSDAGTMASQNANSVNIDGGTIDGTTIGVSSVAVGNFSNVNGTGNGSFSGYVEAFNSMFMYNGIGLFSNNDTNNSSVVYPIKLDHRTTGTPAVGIGVGIEFQVETSNSSFEVGSVIESVSTDVTLGAEDFDLVFKNVSGGSAASEVMRIDNAGNVTIQGAIVEGANNAPVLSSDVTGVTGADAITNIISLTQAEYDVITPNSTTLYVITG